ncbi:hypothetical protein SUGI_1002030 [Cryptomeria japonica]|uniref:cellulose synthase A catalytic subunit 7 [UDP-forming] isoform X2 n=1 Tax=Cryptomeria japonica TaxID=3369 RepID=UPI002414C3A6|nr:cellulose synthase A catalytic subunit 7 [UDP-forming] isoform X2 [Cryptomeria japonica]GLJ47471.1 hypothetical protein SUGI_1002030 [Cryptomeria japonica]
MERWDAKGANSHKERPASKHNTVVESGQLLSSRVAIEGRNINLYRLVIVARLIVVGFFFHLRITKPVKDGYGLWIAAVVCEIWLAVSWILDQLPKWSPINRLTYLDRLSARFEKEGEDYCGLANVDVLVSTEDPVAEPPLMTANAILSVLALDYPACKVSCYVSDDASAMLTFECLSETAEFARRWVPFCKEFNIEPRAPEPYFSQKIDYLRDKVKPEFVKKRRQMKREYDEFKVGINALVKKGEKAPEDGWMMQDGMPWPGNNPHNHPGMIQVFLGRTGTLDVRGNELPLLVYMSREKKPGFHHHNKPGAMNALVRVSGVLTNSPYIMNMECTHYINNSKVVREAMCFMMDSLIGRNVSYVQFPLRFHALQQGNKYSSHNSVFYDITMKGLDGIQGPICLGAACVIKRQALYGYVPPPLVHNRSQSLWSYLLDIFSMNKDKQQQYITTPEILRAQVDLKNSYQYDYDTKESLNPLQSLEECLGQSPVYIATTLMEEGGIPEIIDPSSLIKEAIHVINCTYEEKTKWGKEIGWIYGSLTYNVLTGMKIHARGWQSVYCVPFRPAFKVNGTMNLADCLRELLHWALGSMEILLSKHCPLWYRWRSGQLDWLQRIAYINIVVYPLASVPLIAYCFLPAVCLLTGKFIIPPLDNIGIMWVTGLLASVMACVILEMKWSHVEIEEWWRNQQFWVIGGTSSHFFAILQGLLKVLTGIETTAFDSSHAKPTCETQDEADDLLMYRFKWTNLLIIPTTLVIVNILAVVAGISATFNSGYEAWESLSKKLCFAIWVLVHLYPFLRGLLGRQNRTPTIVIIWSTLLASIFSLLWIRADPFIEENKVADVQHCTFDCS